MARIYPRLAALVALATLSACSGAVLREDTASEQALTEWRSLAADPAAAAGTYAVLGGEILELRAEADGGTTLVIQQRPLTVGQRPSTELHGEGCFAVHYPDALDPHLFRRSQRVTVSGLVRGQKGAPGGAATDPALWLEGQKIQLWERPEWPLMMRLRNQREWLPWWYDPYYGRRPWWW